MAGGFDADEGLRFGGVEVRKRVAQGWGQRFYGGDSFRRNSQDGFAEAVDFASGALECGGVGIADRAGDHDLQRVALVKQRGEAVGGGEQAELRNESCEGLQSFFGPIAIELFTR